MSESIGVSFDGKGINMSVSFEKGVSTEVGFPQGANVDLSGVAQEQTLLDKADEIKQAVENAKPEIDTTALAKQGENQGATNTAIYDAVKGIMDRSAIYNKQTGNLTIENVQITIE